MGKIIKDYYGDDTTQIEYFKEYQTYQVPEGARYIGCRRLYRKDGYEKASGKGKFTRDITLPGMLYAKIMPSPHGHAKLLNMDTSKAEALLGVRYILRFDDPELAGHASSIVSGIPLSSHELIDSQTQFYKQPVACAVAADSPDICDEALRQIEIQWKELPVLVDWEKALRPGATIIHPEFEFSSNLIMDYTLEEGDVERGMEEADQIITYELRTEETDGATTEGGCTIAHFKGEYLEAWDHIQDVYLMSKMAFGTVPLANQNLHVPYQGAMFGGINWLPFSKHRPWVAAVLARKTGLPVKLLWDEQHWYASDWGYGTTSWKVGFKNDATITAIDVENLQTGGGTTACLEDIIKQSSIKNFRCRGMRADVSRGPTICFRDATYLSQANTLLWQKVAAALDIDPEIVFSRNHGANGMAWNSKDFRDKRSRLGFDPDKNSLTECLAVAKNAIVWENAWHAPGERRLPNGRYHGIGVQWSHEWANWKRPCLVGLVIRSDGTVTIDGRHSDIGCDHATSCCQIVADELGIPFEMVNLRPFNSTSGHELQSPGGSSNMVANGPSMVRVARKAKQMLLELATQPGGTISQKITREWPELPPAIFPGKIPKELDVKDGLVFEKANPENKKSVKEVCSYYWGMHRQAMYREPVQVDDFTGPISARPANCQQIHITEVEVDADTGRVIITRVVTVNDVGRAMNPDAVNGQQYGGAYMGISRSNQEEMFFDEATGVKLNDDLIQYPIALMNDIGPIDCHIVETGLGYGAYGACGIGENIGTTMSSATNAAVYNAIGKWVDHYPTTPEKVLRVLGKI